MHAALGDSHRLAIVDDLIVSDRSPRELSARLGIASNLLAHHLEVLESAGVIRRTTSAADRRRRYIRLDRRAPVISDLVAPAPQRPLLFLCTHNSARSQLAAVMWTARTGRPAGSAGTQPTERVHRGAVAAARRLGLSLDDAAPCAISTIPETTQVITVCDTVHEELDPGDDWHWSIPDPVTTGDRAAFDIVVDELTARIEALTHEEEP
jgi:ArsR family transcriptional regulator, arsenate/arsenite/antimonite-responsive transcriptional repressor / arsenate reductase (thioredoxin)